MPNGGISVGRDITVQIDIPNYTIILPPDVISDFEATPKTNMEAWIPITGIVQPVLFHLEWEGKFNLARKNSNLDLLWAQMEEDYYNGVNLEGGIINETIKEVDGRVTQFQYTGVMLKVDTLGAWKGNELVKQAISFMASRRLKLT